MTVSTIASIAAGLSRTKTGNQTTQATALLKSLFSGNQKSGAADTTQLTAALTMQNQVAQFRVAAQNLAQASSLLAAADSGAGEISRAVGRLKELATQASSSSVSEKEREQILSEFNALRSRIDNLANGTSFSNEKLLNGSSPQLKIGGQNPDTKDLSIGSLTDEALFKGAKLDLSTTEGAKAALTVIDQAKQYADQQVSNIAALQSGLDYAASTLGTAIQNTDASRSTLDESDLVGQLLGSTSDAVASDFTSSLFAQTNRLPGNIMQLLSE